MCRDEDITANFLTMLVANDDDDAIALECYCKLLQDGISNVDDGDVTCWEL